MRVLSADDVGRAVPMPAAIDAVEAAFVALAAGQAEVPLRTHLETPERGATSFFMPARLDTPAGAALGMKVVSVFPTNLARHEPSIYALVALLDPETGRPQALLDGTYLTALRTGAASGVATRHMARADARVLALFGAGAQALPQARAVWAVRPIETVWIVNRSPERAAALAAQIRAERPELELRQGADGATALAAADVVCTATSSPAPLFAADAVRPGTHINAVGAYKPTMAELPPELLARVRLVVDQRRAAWAEAGELVQAREAGLLREEQVAGELGEVAAGQVAGRAGAGEITCFKSVGNAVQDLAVAALALGRATELGLGTEVALFQ